MPYIVQKKYMKKVLFICLLSGSLLVACSSSKKNAATSSAVSASMKPNPSDADGSSYEKAIVIQENKELVGVDAEYKWIRKHYPGYTLNEQKLNFKNKIAYDIVNITLKDGNKKNIYFDISNFYGKF